MSPFFLKKIKIQVASIFYHRLKFCMDLQRLYQSLVQGCSFSYKLCYCWTLFIDGTISGWAMMSSSG